MSPSSPELPCRVIPFRPRRSSGRIHSPHPAAPPRSASEAEADTSDQDRDDFRHRAKTNLASLAVVVVLICCGLWLADTLAQMRKAQDCVLSGRHNCTPVALPAPER